MICLDTTTIIAAIDGRERRVRERLQTALSSGSVVAIPVMALYELHCGVRKSARPEANRQALIAFLTLDLPVWPFEEADAEEAGDIRALLERAGTPIGAHDVLIAAQARRRRAILITANAREFARVPGLTTDDWARS